MNGIEAAGLGAALSGLDAYLIREIPRREHRPDDAPGAGGDSQRPQRLAALVAAYHAGLAGGTSGAGGPGAGRSGPVAFGWIRTAAGGPVRVFAAGETLAGSGDSRAAGGRGEVLLSLPAGARARVLAKGELGGLVAALGCWRPVAAISDALLAADGDRAGRGTPPGPGSLSLDDGLLGSWNGPFGWLVLAEPVPGGALRGLAEEAGLRQRVAQASADRFPDQDTLARRLKDRYAELRRGGSAGFWRITLAAGGTDPASAARVAGLLCASADLSGLPYALTPVPPDPPRPPGPPEPPLPAGPGDPAGWPDPACWSDPAGWPDPAGPDGPAAEPGGDGAPAAPFYGSTELLAALARPPEAEVPGVRFALRPEFDVTPEVLGGEFPGGGRPGIRLGQVLDRNLLAAGPLTLTADALNRHVFVCGATGAGKSQTVRGLLEAVTGLGIPWLVIEPAKAEYRLMASRLPGTEVIRIRPGEPDAVAAGLNPLEPAGDDAGRRFPLQTHADLVKALFIASFQAEEPFPQVLSAALSRIYTEAGWDLALGEPRRAGAAYPTLTGLQRTAERVVAEIGYSQRVTDDVLGFIRVRLASLRQGTTGRFLEGGHPLDFGALLRSNVVLEIEDVGDDADKAFLMGTVLIRLAEHLRLAHRDRQAAPGLRHLTVVEEAHRLLRRPEADSSGRAGAAGHAVELFAGLLAEIRAYGEGLVIAEQIPARLVPDVIKNTAVKLTHRLPAADDREAVGATMNATPPQSRYLVTLPPGQAAVFSDGMDFPVLVQIDDGTERELASPPAPTADAAAVVRPRSASCGPGCAAHPCTLRALRQAERVREDVPWVDTWAELAVLAHLTGWPMPVPVPPALARLRTGARSQWLRCALAQAADAAVAVRPAAAEPAALAAHVTEALLARAERDEWRCAPDEPRWLADGELTPELTLGTARIPLLADLARADGVLEEFIDCRWPLRYLPASSGLGSVSG